MNDEEEGEEKDPRGRDEERTLMTGLIVRTRGNKAASGWPFAKAGVDLISLRQFRNPSHNPFVYYPL